MCVALIDISFHLILSGLIEYTMKIFDRPMYSTVFSYSFLYGHAYAVAIHIILHARYIENM